MRGRMKEVKMHSDGVAIKWGNKKERKIEQPPWIVRVICLAWYRQDLNAGASHLIICPSMEQNITLNRECNV